MHTIMVGLAGQLHVYEAKCRPKWASRSPLTGWPLLRTIKAECRTTREVILVCSHASILPIRLATTNHNPHCTPENLVGTIEPSLALPTRKPHSRVSYPCHSHRYNDDSALCRYVVAA